MPLLYVLDEDLRGPLWRHIIRYNARGVDTIDVVRVGDSDDLPTRILDPDILQWCESHHRILVTHDRSTAPVHLQEHVVAGHHCPGIFLVRDVRLSDVVAFLALAGHEWQDQYFYIP